MSHESLLLLAGTPANGFCARLGVMKDLIEEFVMTCGEVPRSIHPSAAILLGCIIAHRVPVRYTDVVGYGYQHGHNASYALRSLSKRGYLRPEADPEDRRSKYYCPTEKGKQVGGRIARVLRYVDDHVGTLFDASSFEEARGRLGKMTPLPTLMFRESEQA